MSLCLADSIYEYISGGDNGTSNSVESWKRSETYTERNEKPRLAEEQEGSEKEYWTYNLP